ncbi:MAG: hypothetical protein IKR26_03225 [Lachnospiraceae bacterium]|nr:hypothetical protein [Lachnospiraceae bacterium]
MKNTINFVSGAEIRAITLVKPLTVSILILAAAAAAYFGIIRKYTEIASLSSQLNELRSETAVLRAQNEEYDQVREEYLLYGDSYLTEDEACLADRTFALEIMEKYLLSSGNPSRLQLAGNEIAASVFGFDMADASRAAEKMMNECDGVIFAATRSARGTDDEESYVEMQISLVKSDRDGR